MIFLAYTSMVFLGIRLLVALFNLFSRPILLKSGRQFSDLVSVLVPARNEQERLPSLLGDLQMVRDVNLEIVVYDDHSSDMTAVIVERFMEKDGRIRLIRGGELPEGWLGKNHACHVLSQHARGDYFLFLDADVRITPEAIPDALAFMRRKRLDLLSLFPVQKMLSLAEKVTVPLINWLLLSMLPLWLIGNTRRPSLAAANGQCMLFPAVVYRKHHFHQQVRGDRVEDIRIIRKMKAGGYRCQTLLSSGQVSCRMYGSYREAVDGFTKNVNAFFGNSWLLMLLFGLLTTFGPVSVALALDPWALFVYLAGVMLLKTSVAWLSRQSVPIHILLTPLQMFSFWLIMLKGGYKYFTGTMKWKGRSIR